MELVRKYPDAIEIVLKRDIGISLPEGLFKRMLETFKSEDGHLYKYFSKFNLPYAFDYMANNQNLMYAKLDFNKNNKVSSEIISAIRTKSNWCYVNDHAEVRRKKGVKGFVEMTFHFSEFEYDEIDGEKYQKFTLIIKEVLNKGKPSELLRTEIKFDQFYYYNIVNRRERYLAAVNEVY